MKTTELFPHYGLLSRSSFFGTNAYNNGDLGLTVTVSETVTSSKKIISKRKSTQELINSNPTKKQRKISKKHVTPVEITTTKKNISEEITKKKEYRLTMKNFSMELMKLEKKKSKKI